MVAGNILKNGRYDERLQTLQNEIIAKLSTHISGFDSRTTHKKTHKTDSNGKDESTKAYNRAALTSS